MTSSQRNPPISDLTGLIERIEGHQVATGGFSDVYKCKYLNRDEYVAVKVLRIHTDANKEIIIKKLMRELETWEPLEHPNALKLLGIVNDEKSPLPCLVSPWMKNGVATVYLRDTRDTKLIPFLWKVAEGIDYLHGKDIAHGDIRGHNILVTDAGEPCISDFGVSKFLDVEYTTSMGYANTVGRWSAIEYCSGDVSHYHPTKAGDVWSFGMTCLELWSGKQPYDGMSRNQATMAVKEGALPVFPKPFRRDFVSHMERIKVICNFCWEREKDARVHIDTVMCILRALVELDEASVVHDKCIQTEDVWVEDLVENQESQAFSSPELILTSNSQELSLTGESAPVDQTVRTAQYSASSSIYSMTPDSAFDDGISDLLMSPTIMPMNNEVTDPKSMRESSPPSSSILEAIMDTGCIKSALHKYCQHFNVSHLRSRTMEQGARYHSISYIKDREYGSGYGTRRKDAEDQAVKTAFLKLYDEDPKGVDSQLPYQLILKNYISRTGLVNRVQWRMEEEAGRSFTYKIWISQVFLDGKLLAEGRGSTKREADAKAGKRAIVALRIR